MKYRQSTHTRSGWWRPASTVPVIPVRSNPDLFEIGVAGEGAEALLGERIPRAAERVDDGVVVVEQAVAQMLLAQEQPDPLHRVELGRIGRQPDEGDVARDHELPGPVPA